MFLLFCLADLLILFFLSRLITRALSRLIHARTRKLSHTVKLFSFVLFPGTFIHELAHYLTAHVLGVKTFSFDLLPELEGESVRLGSVSMEQSDIVRRTIIGVAPLIIGLASIFFCFWLISRQSSYVLWQVALAGIFTFQMSNTMFPSKADMKGSAPLFVVIVCVAIAFLFFTGGSLDEVYVFGTGQYFKTALYYLSVVIAIDIIIFTVLRVLLQRR